MTDSTDMQRLWAPWRMTYVAGEKRTGCVFCNAVQDADDRESLVLYRGQHAFLILNLFPYNSGHMMAVPNQHASQLDALSGDARAELMELSSLAVDAARRVLDCHGFNLGLNLGEVAGAGVADHLHLHVVPRWTGDANFMPIIGATMVLPELLPVTYARLRGEIEGIVAERRDGAVRQAGAIVVLPESGEIALRRAVNGDIVLPKGHIEPGETAAAAAIREVREETGIDATILGWAGTQQWTTCDTGRPETRHVAWFIATGVATDATVAHLTSDTLLAPAESAAELLSFEELRSLVSESLPLIRRVGPGEG